MVKLSERFRNYVRGMELHMQSRRTRKFNAANTRSGRFSDLRQHTLVCGVPRGGTTWLHELLLRPTDATIWEPLHFNNLLRYPAEGFFEDLSHLPYVPEHAEWEEPREFFTKLLHGELPYGLDSNADRYPRNLDGCSTLAFKFCRANLMLPWLTRQFPELRPVVIVRHPLTTIASQYRHRGMKDVGVKHRFFDLLHPRHTDVLDRYRHHWEQARSRAAVLANFWAIQHVELLAHPAPGWLMVSYEHIFSAPEEELQRIGRYLGRDLSGHVSRVHRPSSVTVSGSLIITDRDRQLRSWEQVLTPAEVSEIMEIIQAYSIDLYDTSPMPLRPLTDNRPE